MASIEPVQVGLRLRTFAAEVKFPPETQVLRRTEPAPLDDVEGAVRRALEHPIGTPSFSKLCRAKLAGSGCRASGAGSGGGAGSTPTGSQVVVVISDNTRPVPYRGEGNLLWPLVDSLLEAGFSAGSITILVATGMHRVMADEEIWSILDERVRQAGVKVACHDALDREGLVPVGKTAHGVEVFMDRRYVEADFRILTGLVEPHSAAGASGGRKSLCPGLVDVRSLQEFHGPRTLAHERATDLVLEGNPCHEAALEIARMAPPDFIVNVTARVDGQVAGIFAGDMEKAHLAAFEHLRGFAGIPLARRYDVVATHAGLVGINFYQVEKAASAAARAARAGGYVVVVADTVDVNPIGTPSYRGLLKMLVEVGREEFLRRIMADNWEFRHDQWGVQGWSKFLGKIPYDHLFFFSPQMPLEFYPQLVCRDPRPLLEQLDLEDLGKAVAGFMELAVAEACRLSQMETGHPASVAYLADGPYGIPLPAEQVA